MPIRLRSSSHEVHKYSNDQKKGNSDNYNLDKFDSAGIECFFNRKFRGEERFQIVDLFNRMPADGGIRDDAGGNPYFKNKAIWLLHIPSQIPKDSAIAGLLKVSQTTVLQKDALAMDSIPVLNFLPNFI